MGGCLGKSSAPPAQTQGNTVKLLCLGVGGCGKTTFIKMMKIIHDIPFNDIELTNYKKIVRTNLVMGMQNCLDLVKKYSLELDQSNNETSEFVSSLKARAVELDGDTNTKLKQIWSDPSIQKVVDTYPEQLVITHIKYFYQHYDRIASEAYVPTEEDIVRCRQRTAGASSFTIFVDKYYFDLYDIGGQRPERAKWEQILKENNFGAVLYFVAADEFDVDDEDNDDEEENGKFTKMEVSRYIFSELLNSGILPESVPVVLFFNRRDMFEKRIKSPESQLSFKKTFPNFEGEITFEDSMDYLRDSFLSTKKEDNNSQIIVHYTCVLDVDSMVVVWQAVRDFLLRRGLEDAGVW
eukprot:TRINITY_DN5402_c0_g1_i2.p1 TRINITY_DN5402_c0_g1~~TRINITY_DN5402_c0_g1_i2.p1  ORF type:complete len:351 (-),score=74.54 TRINITY_DN5402_c0_g1_i2:166-1218(-)